MLVILLLAIGATVFIVLNKPANLLIRKTFKSLTGLEVISAKAYEQVKADNLVLTQLQKQSRAKADSLEAVNRLIIDSGALKDLRINSLQTYVKSLTAELHRAKDSYDSLSVPEKFAGFDRMTEGSKATFISLYEGVEVAITEPDRITQATWKLMEGNSFRLQAEAQMEHVAALGERVEQLKSINSNLGLILDECRDEVAIEAQKRENCEAAEKQTLNQGKKIAGVGLVSLILTIAIIVL